jgi:alpha-L-rhamnosidase
VWVPYSGKKLSSKSLGYWKVRVWDEQGKASAWSGTASFGVGLLTPSDWKAVYIGEDRKGDAPQSPLLWKNFRLSGTGTKALLHVNSLGYHEVYVNGKPVSDAVLSPAVAQYDKRSITVTYDVTSMLHKGKNDIVVWLGKGWYNDGLAGVVKGGPFLRAQIDILQKGRWHTALVTNNSWKARESGYVSTWRKGKLGGEQVDGALLPDGFTAASLSKSKWGKTKVVHIPYQHATPQMVEPNRIQKEIHPIARKQINDSTWVYDMGTTLTGWLRLNFPSLTKGQTIRINYSDRLTPHGTYRRSARNDTYTASGKGNEKFSNKFNYHGFRYIKITNIKEGLPLDSVTACLIRTDYSGNGTFICSDRDMNAIHNLVKYTLQCLTLGGNMVDCPHIERLGYGGDGNASTITLQTIFNAAPLYYHWMTAWSDCQEEDGKLPYTAPHPVLKAGGGAYWCLIFITAPWQAYVNYGDPRLLELYYPQMKKWLSFIKKYSPNGLLKPWPAPWYLGDWAPPAGVDPIDTLSVDLVNNCVVVEAYQTMEKIAKVLGKDQAEIKSYADDAKKLRKLIHSTFYDSKRHSYSTGSQTDIIYPMLVGATPEEEIPGVLEYLEKTNKNRFKGHLFTGLVGVPTITEWAIRNHKAEMMYSMLKKREQPSYLFMLDQGATTTWEWWNGRRSRIHNCYPALFIGT